MLMKLNKYVHDFRCSSFRLLFPSVRIPNSTPTSHSESTKRDESLSCLESGLGVLDEVLKVGLVPLTGLGRGVVGIRVTAEAVVADGRGVAGAVRLATGLDPDEGIGKLGAGGGSRADTEAGSLDVAPVAPFLTETGDGVTAGIDNGVVGHAGGLEGSAEGLDVDLLVLALVVLGIRGRGELAGALVPRIPAGNVGGNTTELLGLAGGSVGLGQLLRTGLEVGVPAEPAAVSGINVHDDIGEVEVLEGVRHTVAVTGSAVLAGLEVGVGDEVGERVGLDDEGEGRVGVGLEDLDNGWLLGLQRSARRSMMTDFGANLRSMYWLLYLLISPTFSSPLEALAAQSRPGRS